MVARATVKLDYAVVITKTVEAAKVCTVGMAAIPSSATTVEDHGADDDNALGVVIGPQKATPHEFTAGQSVQIALTGVVPVLVGTGDATQGAKAVLVADGFADAPAHDSDGTGNEAIYGMFLDSGVAGDYVGMLIDRSNRGS